jgi:hypothetical protein
MNSRQHVVVGVGVGGLDMGPDQNLNILCSAMDWQGVDADPDPDSTFYFDADPDSDPILKLQSINLKKK